ncbi:hypothetical protein SAMN05443575_1547 [Jatrophihabitans endophyticus]|uniref:Uncharacterized protein n=1 Tax=Jatrophihabitans endophyticus TaxID=1206085 RepID=A0A1M5HK89_9ACTN|nr:hypothetical protein [Jatrophihabitans endophyticus]SHG16347.1 hypothetical protein SAMN05443575_1547 [Jatrophihabitans endophyticus]
MRALLAVATSVLSLAVAVPATAAPSASSAPSASQQPLTNLAHLDFLTQTVTPPAQAGHSTYAPARPLRELWVYAEHRDDGSYERVGGGPHHAETDTYDQGAYDSDDIARAAVVYLRHWRQFGDAHSREYAFDLLRGLTYLQTATGPNAGNVVLWMQPDGTLNASALPREEPDPSDSANSYWLARTIWALGEGYRAFVHQDPAFARFLRARLGLALDALERDSLSRYGTYHRVDGVRTPAWLIADGADASGEAVLGLAAYVRAGGRDGVRALRRLSDGIAQLGTAPSQRWPYGAILPSALSRSSWHAWGGLAPAGLARASAALDRRALARVAVADAAAFSPALLTRYGAVNGLLPAPVDRSTIAYGVDSRVQSSLAAATVSGSRGLRQLAGVWAGWYFGQNAAASPTYDPGTGVTYDGIAADGTVNRNSGAESTIHGLLSMLALDAAPDVARLARASGAAATRDGTTVVEAEDAAVTGAAAPTDAPAGTAESSWSGQLLAVSGAATARWTLPAGSGPRFVEAVVDRTPGPGARATVTAGGTRVGRFATGGGSPQGDSPAPGRLVPLPVGTVGAGAATLTARFTGGAGRVDALLVTPVVSELRTGTVRVERCNAVRPCHVATGTGRVSVYDASGRTVRTTAGTTVRIPARGFAVVVGR